jgi:hypothetical protein
MLGFILKVVFTLAKVSMITLMTAIRDSDTLQSLMNLLWPPWAAQCK